MTTDDVSRSAARRRQELPPSRIDFSLMYFAHDAFTRDLHRMVEAAAAGRADDPAVREGWETFKRQLHTHHVAEDDAIWPQMREKITDPDEIAIMDLMEAEHGQIDPLLAQVDASLESGSPDLEKHVTEAATALIAHMEHEEEKALPLADRRIGPEGWQKYVKYLQKTQGIGGAAEFLPWALDGVSDEQRKAVLGKLPPPVRLLNSLVFERRYRRTPRWNAA